MPRQTSQYPFLFAALPCTTSSSSSTSLMSLQQQSFGSITSSNISIASYSSSNTTIDDGDQLFYNLSRESNKSNIDLTRTFHPYPTLNSNFCCSTLNISQYNTCGYSPKSARTNTSSSLDLVPSQICSDNVNHAFGSLSSPYPVSFVSASSSSLPLAASVNTPITTPATTTTKALASASSTSLAYRRRSSVIPINQHQQSKALKSDHSLPSAAPILTASQVPSCSLRTLLLPSPATLSQLPSRKRASSAIPPLNTKALPKTASLSPSFLSSKSATMSATSPSSASCLSLSGGMTYSEVSSASGSAPPTPTHSRPFVSMAITELVISEAQFLTAIDRAAGALNQAADVSLAAGLKPSSTIRSLMERWSEMIQMHAKFHNDVLATNEDLLETAGLINSLLVMLEPILIEHGRDLYASLKKLIRRDQNSERTLAEWESDLRQPFEHLSTYVEWLQHIDPESKFCKDYQAHLSGLIYKIKMVTEANQHPRNMLRRISTIARGVINKRRSSVQLLNQSPSPASSSNPHTPVIPITYSSASSTESCDSIEIKERTSQSLGRRTVSQQLEDTVRALAIQDGEISMESTSTLVSNVRDLPQVLQLETQHRCPQLDVQEPTTPIAATFLASPVMADSTVKQSHQASAISELRSVGTLAVAEISSLPASSSVSVCSRPSSCAETLFDRCDTLQQSSLERQKSVTEREAKKATLRVGASESIQARAENLQSPGDNKRRLSAENKKRTSARSGADKPPVKSLISFWEQTLEA
ncbi:hypothetical protein BGX28_002556 [Mortierella sp. GBA30]|nr:hypothetical protein BGX28_002556 [Mortierella sp. GBA30]